MQELHGIFGEKSGDLLSTAGGEVQLRRELALTVGSHVKVERLVVCEAPFVHVVDVDLQQADSPLLHRNTRLPAEEPQPAGADSQHELPRQPFPSGTGHAFLIHGEETAPVALPGLDDLQIPQAGLLGVDFGSELIVSRVDPPFPLARRLLVFQQIEGHKLQDAIAEKARRPGSGAEGVPQLQRG
eukprot:scaffold1298_cov257-Pinguiococcus_pyrenoidosus.AAC.8